MTEVRMLGTDSTDVILGAWIEGTGGISINAKSRDDYPKHIPLAFRSLTKRKLIYALWDEGRDFYYIDTGYIGNLGKRKDFHRVVKNNVQHLTGVKKMPRDRFETICRMQPYMEYKGKRQDTGEAILVVTPSGKPCQFYNVNRDKWLEETISEIKKHTNRPIVIRDKPDRRNRVGDNSLAAQLQTDNIHALVTYNSIAAVEAIHAGVPAFTLAPNAAQSLASQDLSTIEDPYYPAEEAVEEFLCYLAYCQYTPEELADGTAWKLQQEYQL